MDKKLIFAGAFGLLFLGVLVWFLFFRKNPTTNTTIIQLGKKPAQPPKTVTNTVYVNGGGGGNARNDNFPLKQGSYGEKVKQIQAKLKISADGDWGSGTQAALVKAGIASGFSDQAALDKWLNPTSTPDTANATPSTNIMHATVTMNDYKQRDEKYGGLWSSKNSINIYQDADATSKVVTVFQPSEPVANNAFYGMGIVKNGFLLVGYGGWNASTKGWALFSELTQVRKKKWNDRYYSFNDENESKRKTRKRY